MEPILIVDRTSGENPRRVFLVRYVIGEGAGGENRHPIFENELTGYDYEIKMIYPTQKARLDRLQSAMEPHMYGISEALLSKAEVQSISTGENRLVKVMVSEGLISKLIDLYEFAW